MRHSETCDKYDKAKKSDKYFDVKDEENQLNSFIYEAFGLNSNEIRTIEESKVGL